MKNVEKHLVGWLSICLLLCSFPVWAQGDAGDYLTIVGMVKVLHSSCRFIFLKASKGYFDVTL